MLAQIPTASPDGMSNLLLSGAALVGLLLLILSTWEKVRTLLNPTPLPPGSETMTRGEFTRLEASVNQGRIDLTALVLKLSILEGLVNQNKLDATALSLKLTMAEELARKHTQTQDELSRRLRTVSRRFSAHFRRERSATVPVPRAGTARTSQPRTPVPQSAAESPGPT